MADTVPTALANQLQKLQAMQGTTIPQMAQTTETTAPTAQMAETQIIEPVAGETKQQQPVQTEQAGNTEKSTPEVSEDVWKHKYQVLDGKYRADTSRMREEIESLKKQVNELNAKAVTNQDAFDSKTISAISDDEIKRFYTPEFIEEWGEDFCKQQLAVQKAMLSQSKPTAQAETESEESDHDQSVVDMFYSNLDALNPAWEDTYKSDAFKAFLSGRDDLTGKSYGTLLDEAVQKRDAFATNALFTRFKSASVAPQTKPQPQPIDVMPNQVQTAPPVQQYSQMSQADMLRQLAELTTKGLSPLEVAEKQKEIMAQAKSMQSAQPQQTTAAAFI